MACVLSVEWLSDINNFQSAKDWLLRESRASVINFSPTRPIPKFGNKLMKSRTKNYGELTKEEENV